jgi:hypothetical protein
LDAEKTSSPGGHDERVGASPWREREPARSDEVLGAFDVEQDLAFDDVERLVDVGVQVHRGDPSTRSHPTDRRRGRRST